MQALVHTEPFRLHYTQTPDPSPGPEDLLIRVRACGICGSDVHGYTGTTGRRIPPIIMGHEAAGTVAGVGAAVRGIETGDRVCFDSTVYCNRCDPCLAGQYNRCERREVLGVSTPGNRRDGAFAEYVTVPWWTAVRLDERVQFEEATLFEPLAIVLHAVNRGAVGPDDSVLIVGCGTIGLLAIAAARKRGTRRIVATDVRPERLRRAELMGADRAIDAARADVAQEIAAFGGGIDVAIEAVGYAPTIRQACDLTRQGGRVVLLGNLEREVSLNVPDIIARELTLIGSYASAGEYRDAVRLVTDGAIDVRPLLSEIRPLSEGQQAFDRLHEGREDLLKIVLVP